MPEAFTYFGGVDFSGAREPLSNLWSAVGRDDGGKLQILALRPHAFRADLAAHLAGGWRGAAGAAEDARILWGVDFACGLPAGAASHLLNGATDWPRLLAWVADRPPDEVRDGVPEELRTPRATDTGGLLPPFDMRLYRQTVEGIRWLHELREETPVAVIPQAPDAAAAATLIEVSPTATTTDLGLPRRRMPSRPGEHRARAAALRTFLSFADPGCEALAVTLEDAWDATLSCLTAWLAREDLDQHTRAGADPARVRLEGWIYRPPAAVA